MYYKEELINGIWHYKTYPSMEWQPMSVVQLTNKIASLKRAIEQLTPTSVVQAKPEKVRFVRCTKCEGLGHYYENGIIFKCKH